MVEGSVDARSWDRILPNQEFNRTCFQGDDDSFNKSLDQLLKKFSLCHDPLSHFDLVNTPMFTIDQMASIPTCLDFLTFLIRVCRCRNVLEIGSFIGLSAMWMAEALPEDGKVVTLEKFDHFADIARQNFERNGLNEKITLIEGDAFEILKNDLGKNSFDLVFVDGNKERYDEYIKLVGPLVSPKGIIVVDDILFHGDVLNDTPTTEKGMGAQRAMDLVLSWEDWHVTLLPLSNGMMLVTRK